MGMSVLEVAAVWEGPVGSSSPLATVAEGAVISKLLPAKQSMALAAAYPLRADQVFRLIPVLLLWRRDPRRVLA